MAGELYEAIRLLVEDRGISEELIRSTIEEFLLAAYKKKYGTSDNAVVRFSDDDQDVTIYAQREIVEEVYDPVGEIALEDALKLIISGGAVNPAAPPVGNLVETTE